MSVHFTWSIRARVCEEVEGSGEMLTYGASSLTIGSKDLLTPCITFSRLRREILALAFPISWIADVVASLSSSLVVESPHSARAVKGAKCLDPSQVLVESFCGLWGLCPNEVIKVRGPGDRHFGKFEVALNSPPCVVWHAPRVHVF